MFTLFGRIADYAIAETLRTAKRGVKRTARYMRKRITISTHKRSGSNRVVRKHTRVVKRKQQRRKQVQRMKW